MRQIFGWFLGSFAGGFFLIGCLSYVNLSSLKIRDVTQAELFTSKLVQQFCGFLPNSKIPKEPSERTRALQSIGEAMSLDVFLSEWEATRKNLSLDEQALILDNILPRMLYCRPEIGITRICSLVGEVRPHQLAIPSFPKELKWFKSIFSQGPAQGLKTPGENYLSDSIFSAYTSVHTSDAAIWVQTNWILGGRNSVLNLLKSELTGTAPFELLAAVINYPDPELKTALGKVGFDKINNSQEIDESFSLLKDIKDQAIQELLAAKLGGSALAGDLNFLWKGLQDLPQGVVRNAGINAYIKMLASNYPDRAMRFLEENHQVDGAKELISSELIKRGFINSKNLAILIDLAKTTAQADSAYILQTTEGLIAKAATPTLAIQFTEALPDGATKMQAEQVLAQTFPARDPVAASIWINSLPLQSPFRDEAIMHLATAISNDREAAWAWASSISAPELREKALSAISIAQQGK